MSRSVLVPGQFRHGDTCYIYVKVSADAGLVSPRGHLLHLCQGYCRCRASSATGTPATSMSRSVQVPGQFRHRDTCYIYVKVSTGAGPVSPRGHLLHLFQGQCRCRASFTTGTPATSFSRSVQVPGQFRHGDSCYIYVKGQCGCQASFATWKSTTSMLRSVQVAD